MGINKIQFQKGLSMAEFMKNYGTEEKCHAALVVSRWPDGFVCPNCGETSHSIFERKGLQYWQCSMCREQTTAICGTIFQATKLPLTNWFLAMHLSRIPGYEIFRQNVHNSPMEHRFQPTGGIS